MSRCPAILKAIFFAISSSAYAENAEPARYMMAPLIQPEPVHRVARLQIHSEPQQISAFPHVVAGVQAVRGDTPRVSSERIYGLPRASNVRRTVQDNAELVGNSYGASILPPLPRHRQLNAEERQALRQSIRQANLRAGEARLSVTFSTSPRD